jgi:penicillin-binding protein activator
MNFITKNSTSTTLNSITWTKSMMNVRIFLAAATVVTLTACTTPGPYSQGSGTVTYGDSKAVSAVANTFSTTDFQATAKTMVESLLVSPAISEAKTKPRISFRDIANKTGEMIDTTTLSSRMRTDLQKANSIIVIRDSDSDFQNRIKDQQKEQLGLYKSASPNAKGKSEPMSLAANRPDYILDGVLKSIVQRGGGIKQIDYYISLSLINVKTNEEVWSEDKDIRKASAISR